MNSCTCVYVFACICLSLCVYVCVCLFVWCMYGLMHMCLYVSVCMPVCVCSVCMSSCTYLYMHVCVPACVCVVYACAFIYVCMWKPEANNGCLCQSLSTLYLRSGSLSISLSCLANELEESACLSSTSPRLGIDIRCYVWFYVGVGN